jgi:ubiquinone/menaquinone biosynthesis C-methylase UbiE
VKNPETKMRPATELKQIFQDGWNNPARIENYVRNTAEFTQGESHLAWRSALSEAVHAAGRLKILDVGTGPGIFACLYSQMGYECVGFDFSEGMLAVARRRAAEMQLDCTFQFGDAEEPALPESTFDVVSSRHLLFNLPRPGLAIRNWVRLLKPGGRLVLIGNEHTDGQPFSFSLRAKQWLRRRTSRWLSKPRRGWNPGPGYLKAVSECPLFRNNSKILHAVMEAAGLEQIHVVNTDAIREARRRTPNRRRSRMDNAHFFILVGIKP